MSDAQIDHLESTYSYCSVPEPRSRKIVSKKKNIKIFFRINFKNVALFYLILN